MFGPSRSQPLERDQSNTRMAAHGPGGSGLPQAFTDHDLGCCKALLLLLPSFLLADCDTWFSPNGSHTFSTLSATIPADPLGPSEASSIIYCAWYPRLPQQYSSSTDTRSGRDSQPPYLG